MKIIIKEGRKHLENFENVRFGNAYLLVYIAAELWYDDGDDDDDDDW